MSNLPTAYACPVGCGCLWRDNQDGTMSLFGENSKSCSVCEWLPLAKLTPLYSVPPQTIDASLATDGVPISIADHLFIERRGDGIWLVCVEKVHRSEEDARLACRKWMALYAPSVPLPQREPLATQQEKP